MCAQFPIEGGSSIEQSQTVYGRASDGGSRNLVLHKRNVQRVDARQLLVRPRTDLSALLKLDDPIDPDGSRDRGNGLFRQTAENE